MKKIVSAFLFAIDVVSFLTILVIGTLAYSKISVYLDRLASGMGAGGVYYFGVGFAYGIAMFTTAAVGLVAAAVNIKLAEHRFVKYSSIGLAVVFLLAMICAVFIFYA